MSHTHTSLAIKCFIIDEQLTCQSARARMYPACRGILVAYGNAADAHGAQLKAAARI